MTHPRRQFRLYAPFERIDEEDSKTGKSCRRYIRLTYTVSGPDGSRYEKTFPGQTLEAARKRYEQILTWGIWGSLSWRNRSDKRRSAPISLRPVPKAEQPPREVA